MYSHKLNKLHKLFFSFFAFFLYLFIMHITRDHAFGFYQIRMATALYALSYCFSFLNFPLASANMLSNYFIGYLGTWDVIGGFIVGLLTCGIISILGKKRINYLWVAVPIIIIPSLCAPLWLSPIKDQPYFTLFITISIGQMAPATLGMLLTNALETFSNKKGPNH